MEVIIISLGIGAMIGYFICMFKASRLQNELAKIRINALHE